jgi:hypothetical protein
MMFTITADSKPLLDGWGWDDYWSVQDWQTWVQSVEKKYGKKVAKQKFETAWYKQDETANPKLYIGTEKSFISYLKTIDVDILGPIDSLVNGTNGLITGTGDLAAGIGGVGSEAGEALVSRKVKIIITVSFIIVLTIAVYFAYKKYIA